MSVYSPTAVPGADPTNVLGRRIGAYFIDGFLLAVILLAFLIPSFNDKAVDLPASQYDCAIGESGFSRTFDGRTRITEGLCLEWGDDTLKVLSEDDFVSVITQFWVIYAIIQIGNLILLQGLTGASVGKHLVGLRVVRSDGRTAHIGWNALRTLLLQVDTLCCGILGIVLAATTKGHRRLGDMAAGTFVIGKDHVGQPVLIPGLNATWGGQGGPGYTPPSYGGGTTGWSTGATPPQSGYGSPSTPPTPGTWGAPATGADAPMSPTSPPAGPPTTPPPGGVGASPGADAPSWDAARNAYIQYDRELAAWMQWDDAAGEWKPISQ